MLAAEGLTFAYPHRPDVAVDGVSLEVRPGEVIAVLGHNGSGKSTLARLLVGLRAPTAGTVRLDGRDLGTLSTRDVQRVTGYVFQYPEHQFVTGTVTGEVRFGLDIQRRADADRVTASTLEELHLGDLAERHPLSLSGGQKRRLSVATMLVLGPRLLILDEPTYGLDEGNLERLVHGLLEPLRRQGATVVLITHDLRLVAEHAQRVLVMSAGRLVFDGPPTRLLTDGTLLHQVGLVRPPMVELAAGLRAGGWPVRPGTVTLRQLHQDLSLPLVIVPPGER